jgi:hypothetical protein
MKRVSRTLAEKYPPSKPCSCPVCLGYCIRPGWWTLEEAARALNKGYGSRMMLEMSPERTFGVLSPAFKGCEGFLALNEFSSKGCTFLKDNRCELHGTGLQPLECRFCHHDRLGQGVKCHAEIEKEWHTPEGQALVEKWAERTGFRQRLNQLER